MTGRALARSLAPLPEESLRGFLLRLSYRLNLPPSRVAHLCGLVTAQRRVPAGYLAGLPEDRAVVLARAARLTVGEARALTLADLADAYPPLAKGTAAFGRNHAAAQRHWAWDLSSRYCPSCLVEATAVRPNRPSAAPGSCAGTSPSSSPASTITACSPPPAPAATPRPTRTPAASVSA